MIGITNGAFIALIALGYTLVYGIIELINFAHGDLFMLGTFVCLSTLTLLGFSTDSCRFALVRMLPDCAVTICSCPDPVRAT